MTVNDLADSLSIDNGQRKARTGSEADADRTGEHLNILTLNYEYPPLGGGTGEVIGDAGLRVDPEDTATFAASLERVLSDGGLRAELQTVARRCVERVHSWDRIATGYRSLFP